jgi:hypothetical protein
MSCPLLKLLLSWMKSSAAAGDSRHVYSLSPLAASDQVQGLGYSGSKVETDVVALQLETSAATLELAMDSVALELGTDAAGLELEMNTPAL